MYQPIYYAGSNTVENNIVQAQDGIRALERALDKIRVLADRQLVSGISAEISGNLVEYMTSVLNEAIDKEQKALERAKAARGGLRTPA